MRRSIQTIAGSQRARGTSSVSAASAKHRATQPMHAGNQARLRRLAVNGQPLQAKLTIGAVNDPLEHEADAAADRVMRMADPQVSLTAAPTLSRKCAACEENEEKPLQRKAARGGKDGTAAPPIVDSVLGSSGHALDPTTHDFMASRFGADFSDVRIHTDTQAAQSAAAVDARAYTVGNKVVFGAQQYRPNEPEGQRLIAHELAHVQQQQHSAIQRAPLLQRDADTELDQPTQSSEVEYDPDEVYDGDSPVIASSAAGEPDLEQSTLSSEDAQPLGEGATLDEDLPQPGNGAEALDTKQQAPKKKTPPKDAPKKKPPPKKITTIDVDQAKQSMTITWDDGSTETHQVSTGKGLPNTTEDPCKDQTEKNCTPNDTFTVGVLGDGQTKNEHGDKMSWYVEFVPGRGIGIHNSQPVPGVPASHGCVRVGSSPDADALAKKINKNVIPGTTTVTVHGKAATKPWVKAVKKAKKK